MNAVYPGGELALFAGAVHWKRYLARCIAPHIGRHVLDVGAGIGGNVAFLHGAHVESWLCLEPDAGMAADIAMKIAAGQLPPRCRAIRGTLADLDAEARFDTILYLDVLEHIEADGDELARAAGRLNPGGRLVVLVPAHQALYSPFDKAIGHHRRYSRDALTRLAPPGCRRLSARYLDSVGFFASLANRALLRQAMPTRAQIALWDGWMVPVSTWLDPLLLHRFGKSVLAVWRRAGGPSEAGSG